jgi:hypothetical protein
MTVAQARPNPSSLPSRPLGLVAAVVAAASALGLGLLAAFNRTPSPPADVPASLVLAGLLLTPPAIGALGAISRRRVLLVAAGILCLAQSVIAFSGVTLILLVPALLFLRAAVAAPAPAAPPSVSPRVRALRWAAIVALAAPVALFAVLNVGVVGIVGLVALAALAPAVLRRGALSVGLRGALIGVAIVGLVLGAMYAAFAFTQTVCWTERQTPAGVVYERIPVTNEFGPITIESGIVSSGCSGGEPTVQGAALTGILLIGAIAISALAAQSGRTPRPRATGG